MYMMAQENPEKILKISDNRIRNGSLDGALLEHAVPIRSIMKKNVVSLDHTKTAHDAATLMIEKGVGCVVVTAYGKPLGMITERDIICTVVGLTVPLRSLLLSYIASRPLICAKPYQTAEEAAAIMRKYNIRQLLIVDGDKIIGLVTERDLAMCICDTCLT